MFGERLKRARAALGLSMKKLAEQSGVSANMIKKYEHGESMPSSGILINLAKALDVSSSYFFKQEQVRIPEFNYRKRSRTSQKVLNKIKSAVLDNVESWFELKNIWPNFPIPTFIDIPTLSSQIDTMVQAEEAAERVREYWQLGNGPIADLIDVLENQGILVITIGDDEIDDFDGLQANLDQQPILVCKGYVDGARQRFTLAHELGHLLLGDRISENMDEEKVCHRFAGALLVPAEKMKQYLGQSRRKLEVGELYLIKQEFGISMQACLFRARDLQILSSHACKSMFIEFGKRGWRKQEPGAAVAPEKTTQFKRLVLRALGEGIIGESKAAELLNTPLVVFHRERLMDNF